MGHSAGDTTEPQLEPISLGHNLAGVGGVTISGLLLFTINICMGRYTSPKISGQKLPSGTAGKRYPNYNSTKK